MEEIAQIIEFLNELQILINRDLIPEELASELLDIL